MNFLIRENAIALFLILHNIQHASNLRVFAIGNTISTREILCEKVFTCRSIYQFTGGTERFTCRRSISPVCAARLISSIPVKRKIRKRNRSRYTYIHIYTRIHILSPSVQRAVSRMHDVLTKQITVRDIRLAVRLRIIAARGRETSGESSLAITIRHHRSDPFVHLALVSSAHTVPIILAVLYLFLFATLLRPHRTCLRSILIPIPRVYGFACSQTRGCLPATLRTHIAVRHTGARYADNVIYVCKLHV